MRARTIGWHCGSSGRIVLYRQRICTLFMKLWLRKLIGLVSAALLRRAHRMARFFVGDVRVNKATRLHLIVVKTASHIFTFINELEILLRSGALLIVCRCSCCSRSRLIIIQCQEPHAENEAATLARACRPYCNLASTVVNNLLYDGQPQSYPLIVEVGCPL